MSTDLAVVLALLAAAVVMFALNRPRMDAVALIMMTALPLTGVLDASEALAGLSDPNIVLIAALFVIGEGLVRTGVAQRLGDWLIARAGRDETRLLVLMMPVVAGIGSVMSSTAAVAIFIPVMLRISQNTGIAAGRLMMPLSVAALISGMMTLVATPPNLVVNSELVRLGRRQRHRDRAQRPICQESRAPAGRHGAACGRRPAHRPARAHDRSAVPLGIRSDGDRPEARQSAARGEPAARAAQARRLLLLVGSWKAIRRLQSDWKDLIVLELPAELDDAVPAASRAPHALLSLALLVVLMISGVVANLEAALIGCLLMGLLRCIDLDSAYRSIQWKSLILIVGMLPFGLALQKTGGTDLAAGALLGIVGEASPRAVLAGMFVVTAALGLFISNTATAVLMAPLALAVADALQASPHPFAMTVALAASSAFMTPVSSPANTLVVGPGNYTFFDFVRVGVPFTLIALIVSVVLVPWLLPL